MKAIFNARIAVCYMPTGRLRVLLLCVSSLRGRAQDIFPRGKSPSIVPFFPSLPTHPSPLPPVFTPVYAVLTAPFLAIFLFPLFPSALHSPPLLYNSYGSIELSELSACAGGAPATRISGSFRPQTATYAFPTSKVCILLPYDIQLPNFTVIKKMPGEKNILPSS